jgi:hypothetical protein
MRAAAEAMKKALILDDVKRRGLFVMERAETRQLAAAADQPHLTPDQAGKRDSVAQFVEKVWRECHF